MKPITKQTTTAPTALTDSSDQHHKEARERPIQKIPWLVARGVRNMFVSEKAESTTATSRQEESQARTAPTEDHLPLLPPPRAPSQSHTRRARPDSDPFTDHHNKTTTARLQPARGGGGKMCQTVASYDNQPCPFFALFCRALLSQRNQSTQRDGRNGELTRPLAPLGNARTSPRRT